MKTVKIIIGIISIVSFIIIIIQSCAVGIANAFEDNTSDSSGSAGFILAFATLIAGIVGVVTRKSKGGGIATGIIYLIASIIGFANLGTFGDLIVWSILSLIFGITFLLTSILMKKPDKNVPKASEQ